MLEAKRHPGFCVAQRTAVRWGHSLAAALSRVVCSTGLNSLTVLLAKHPHAMQQHAIDAAIAVEHVLLQQPLMQLWM